MIRLWNFLKRGGLKNSLRNFFFLIIEFSRLEGKYRNHISNLNFLCFSFPLQASKVWMLIRGIYADFIFQRSFIPKASLYFPISCCHMSVFVLFVSCACWGTVLPTCCFTSCWKLVVRGTAWCWPLIFYRPDQPHGYCSSKNKSIKDFL